MARNIILDTSFIMAAVRHKIDFFHQLEQEGFDILIPEQTLKELRGLGDKLALKILDQNNFKELKLPGKDADNAIIYFSKKNPSAVVATLDKGLQKKLKSRKMIIRQKKKLEIVS